MHEGHRERLRQRAKAEGLSSFQEHEVLELILYPFVPRKNTNEIAHKLIETFGSFAQVLEAEADELFKIKDMTKSACEFLTICPDLSRFYGASRFEQKPVLDTIKKCAEYLSTFMATLNREEVYMLCMDSRSRLLKRIHLQTGIVNQSSVYLRDVLQYATMYNASSVILAHNHPSGLAEPTMDDATITKTLAVALGMIKIPLIDHIIIAGDSHYSFKRDGRLDEFRQTCLDRIKDGNVMDIIR